MTTSNAKHPLSPVRRRGKFTFTDYLRSQSERLKQLNRLRTAETYATALNSLLRFRNGSKVSFREVDSAFLEEYEAYMKSKGITPNTTSFYMRILRAVYNRAVRQGLTPQRCPFGLVYTGVAKTMKRALSLSELKRIKELDLSRKHHLEFARDMFLFSFYTRGMSFIDMAYLKKTNLENGVLSYRRRKTGQQLFIHWEQCMQQIINKYPPNPTEYLLPLLTNTQLDFRRQYDNSIHRVNSLLKKVGKMAGLQMALSMYVARHSWASVAHNSHIPLAVISEGMGHDSEATTRIYLASLDSDIIDNANQTILSLL